MLYMAKLLARARPRAERTLKRASAENDIDAQGLAPTAARQVPKGMQNSGQMARKTERSMGINRVTIVRLLPMSNEWN
jgi:hypothetical protein